MTTSSEKMLISSVLRQADVSEAMAKGINPAMFHSFNEEWEWIDTYYRKHRKTPSKAAFRDQFPEFRIKAVDDTGHFTDEVRKSHSRTMMLKAMKEVGDLIAEGNIEAASSLMQTKTIEVAAAMGGGQDDDIFAHYEDVYQEAEARLKRVNEIGTAGIPTGFQTIDDRTGGPQPGDLWIWAARLGEGKSWALQRMAATAARSGKVVQFDALEQSKAQVTFRVHAFLSSEMGKKAFRTSALMQGKDFDSRDYRKFLDKLKKDIKGRLHVWDARQGRLGLSTLAAQIERNRPDVVYIDYMTLMDKKGSDWQDVAAISGGVKMTGMNQGVPIIAAAQLNREKGLSRGNVGAEALAQSDSIGQDADVVVTQKQPFPTGLEAYLAKSRNTQGQFKFYMEFKPDEGILREVSHEKFIDLKDRAEDEA